MKVTYNSNYCYVNKEISPRDIGNYPAYTTVLEFLRSNRLVGTKEGCATGDCGACNAVTVSLVNNKLVYESLNTCIALLPAIAGKLIITIDGLSEEDKLHPVQKAIIDNHGSQCGFCTPGIIMSLYAYLKNDLSSKREDVIKRISGNLCRCTGYVPIINAGLQLTKKDANDYYAKNANTIKANLRKINPRTKLRPKTVKELAATLKKDPTTRIVAGSTDLGLEVTQNLVQPNVVFVEDVNELTGIKEYEDYWVIGANTSWKDCEEKLGKHIPGLTLLLHRFGSPQIRARATIGGNIGNASPKADGPPVFLALGCTLTLQNGSKQRQVKLEDFYTGYRNTVLQKSEFIHSLKLIKPKRNSLFNVYKISKRYEDDISTLCGAFSFLLDKQQKIVDVKIAFGGMSAIPLRAYNCEQALINREFSLNNIEQAVLNLQKDYQSLKSVRASSEYRFAVAKNLLIRFYLENKQEDCRLRRVSSMKQTIGIKSPHEAAHQHVQGSAPYIDDFPELTGMLYAAVGKSPVAHGKIISVDLSAVKSAPGVVDVIDAKAIPGSLNIAPVFGDENVFASDKVEFMGQAIFAVLATNMDDARRAAKLAKIKIKELKPVLSIEEALDLKSYVVPKKLLPHIERDWSEEKLNNSPHTISGIYKNGGQEHFYLEGQVATAVPHEDGKIVINSSTQHPSEIQHTVAHMLNIPISKVETRVRRMGGGFGGKETQACQVAAIAAVFAQRNQVAVKLRLPRADDFLLTGKRHPFSTKYNVGFDKTGKILACDYKIASDCGISADLSLAVLDRAVWHIDNAYYLPSISYSRLSL